MITLSKNPSNGRLETRLEPHHLDEWLKRECDRTEALGKIKSGEVRAPPRPVMRISQVIYGAVPSEAQTVEEWMATHTYHLRCMVDSFYKRVLKTGHASRCTVDKAGFERDFLNYTYWTSVNRHRKYVCVK